VKTEKEIRKEVDKILADKVSVAVKVFQVQRDSDFKELMDLYQTLETIEAKKAPFLKEQSGLNRLKDKDLGRFNYLAVHLPYLDREAKRIRGYIEKVTQKLTEVPDLDNRTFNLLSRTIDLKS
jgi:hypothetical protein